jgi:RHS repeat-associated protein
MRKTVWLRMLGALLGAMAGFGYASGTMACAITITSPTSTSVYNAPATINIAGNHDCPSYFSIYLYDNGYLITTLPGDDIGGRRTYFSHEWNYVAAGTHRLTAYIGVAGVTSSPVTITVRPPRDAIYLSRSVPTTMVAGRTYAANVQMRNTGSVTWTSTDGYKLGSQNPPDNGTWGLSRVDVPGSVATDQTASFDFSVRAPATGGTYNFQWKMLREGDTWFGQATPNIAITVLAGSISASPTVCAIPYGATTCSASINWSSNAANAQVWVTGLDGSNPQLFASGQSGAQAATWISASGARFHLKSGSDTLNTVDVRGNLPPDITLNTPANGSAFVAPANIAVSANASDPDGSIQRVEFWGDGARMASVTSAPFQATWSNVAAGSHTVRAIAYDNLGNSTWTSTSTVTVRNSIVLGNVDGVSSGGIITGWSCSSYLSQSIPVHLYFGGPAGSGTFIGSYQADQSSEPAMASACGVGSGSYRYRIALSDTQRIQYGGKTIYIHGISPVGGSNNLLGGSGNFAVPLFILNAQFISQTVSAAMLTGRTQSVSVQMRNNGDYTWSAGTNFRLGSQNPADNATWGTGRAYLTSDAAPGQTATFNFTITAPSAPGSYNFQWRMLQEGVAWFGDLTPNVAITVSTPPPVVSFSASVDYDELGRVIARRDSTGSIKASYAYDANSNVTKVTDSLGNVTTMTYDALDRVSRSTDATNHATSFQYDVADRLINVADPRGNATAYTYDGFGQLWQQVSPDTGTTTFAYDPYGLLLSMTRADGVRTTYGYDVLHRRTSISAGGQAQQATYDSCTNGLGRLCSASDATGTTFYSYTPEGQIAGRGFSISGTTYALGYSYDSVGRVAAVVYPDGNRANYSYANGRVAGVAMTVGGVTTNVASAVTYRPDGVMASWTSSNGLANTLAYDGDGRLSGISVPGVQSLAFAYDDADRISRITHGIDGTLTQSFGYDALSRLTSVASAASNESYQYDATGNRIGQTVNGVSTPGTIDAASNKLLAFGATSYGYDANGNMMAVAGASRYHYDAFNRMDSAAGTSYYVNPEGQRLRKSGSAGTSYFAPDQSNAMLSEYTGGWIDYVWLNGRLIGRVAGGQLYAIHNDQVGRPEAVTNASKAIVWRAQNFAFNQNVVTSGITFNLGLPGQYYDAETSAWNNGYRDYKSELGRYLQSDPIGLDGGVNTYVYVGGNPISNIDPLGLRALTDCEKSLLTPYIPQVDLDNADLHDGEVPRYLPSDMAGITRGNDIYFRPGVYEGGTVAGTALLAHELVHVGQYRNGMTWYKYLWSTRKGYSEDSKYEKPAYALERQVNGDLTNAGTDCTCRK